MKSEYDHHSESKHSEVEVADDAFYTFNRYRSEVYTLACSPTDPTLVAMGGDNDFGCLFKIAEKGPGWAKPLVAEHIDTQSSLAFSYDGQLLASGCTNGVVILWDASGNPKGALMGPTSRIKWVKWHPTEHTILTSYVDSNVWMWNADTLAFVKSFAGHGPIVTCGDFTPDGKLVCTGSKDATLRIWKPETGENIHVLRGSGYHTKGLTCLAISSTSTLALTGSEDGSVHIVDITRGRVINTLASHSDFIPCVGFSPSNYWAASGGMDQRLVIWDIECSLPQRTCEHEDGVIWVGSSYVATSCMDGIVRLWDVRSSVCAKTFRGNEHGIKTLSLNANGDYLVSGSWDGTAHVFEVGKFQ